MPAISASYARFSTLVHLGKLHVLDYFLTVFLEQAKWFQFLIHSINVLFDVEDQGAQIISHIAFVEPYILN